MDEMKTYRFADLSVGMKETFSRTITLQMEDAFREITGDYNLLHRDDAYATEVGKGKFKQHVTFGMLTASLYSTLAGMYLPGKYSLIHSLDIKFQKPVFAGDTLTVTGEVVGKEDGLGLILVKAVIKNQDGKKVSQADMKIMVME